MAPSVSTGLGIYFIHSAALPGIYLSTCMYMSPALIWINMVLYCYSVVVFFVNVVADHVVIVITVAVFAIVVTAAVV